MAEYDKTNDGALWPPFEDMELILQGNINVAGRDSRYAFVRRMTRDRKELIEVFEKVGVMFPNDNSKEGAPSYTGTMYNPNDKRMPWTTPPILKRIASWIRMNKDEKPYMSVEISDPQQNQQESNSGLKDDKIPF
mgnify:FL=1|jgi:hypothetical protein|tara:strand:- start:107 stop:511 length:405 start_codon:yes stop_codon:yes gene_type:complete